MAEALLASQEGLCPMYLALPTPNATLFAGFASTMEYAGIEHTADYKVLPPDVAREAAAPTTCDPSQQHDESEFENGDSVVVAPPISRSPEPDTGSESATRACVNEPAPPTTTTTTGSAAVCNTSSPNYCPIDYHNNVYNDKLQDSTTEDATAAEGDLGDREKVEDPYRNNINTDVDDHNNSALLSLGGGVASTKKRARNHHHNIILQGEGEVAALEKRVCSRLREDTLRISDSDQRRTGAGSTSHQHHQQQQQGVSEAGLPLSYLDLRVIQQQHGRFVSVDASSDSRLQDITGTALYSQEIVKQIAVGSERYIQQLTVGPNNNNNNDMPYPATSSPPNSLEDLRMRHQHHLTENPVDEHASTDGNVLAAQSPPHTFQLHSQGMRIRSDAFPFGVLFPHLTTNKILPEPHFSTSPQLLPFGLPDNHQCREDEDIDKTRNHHEHHSQVNGIDDVIHATLKPEDNVNSSDEPRSERNHHPHHHYLLSRTGASPQHPDHEEYLERHQESSSPEIRRNGRSVSPKDDHLQHHRDVILSGRTQVRDSGGGGGGRTPLLGNSNLSSGTPSAGDNTSSNAASFTHLTSLQPSSSSTPSPLELGGNTTAEDGGGRSGSVLQQLSPAGGNETNDHRGMYATTPTSALEHHHHHHHHLSGLHHTTGFHPHDTSAVSSASALMHSPATNLTR